MLNKVCMSLEIMILSWQKYINVVYIIDIDSLIGNLKLFLNFQDSKLNTTNKMFPEYTFIYY